MTRPAVIVTGVSGAIGAAVASDLSTDHRVIGLTRTPIAHTSPEFEWVETDYSGDALEALAAQSGEIHALVHTVGIAPRRSADAATDEDWAVAFSVNVTLAGRVIRTFLPALRRARGRVAVLNSGVGLLTPPDHAVYSASKHALRSLADSVRLQEATNGVGVTSIYPGPVDSPLLRADAEARGVAYDADVTICPDDVARAVRFALTQRAGAVVTELAIRPIAT